MAAHFARALEERFGPSTGSTPGAREFREANGLVDVGREREAIELYRVALGKAGDPALIAACHAQIARQYLNLGEVDTADGELADLVFDDLLPESRELARITIEHVRCLKGDPRGIDGLRRIAGGYHGRDFLAETAAHVALVSVYERAGLMGVTAEWHAYMAVAAKLVSAQRRELPATLNSLGRVHGITQAATNAIWALGVAELSAERTGETSSGSSYDLNRGLVLMAVGRYEEANSLLADWLERYPNDQQQQYVEALIAQLPGSQSVRRQRVKKLPASRDAVDMQAQANIALAKLMDDGPRWLSTLKDRLRYHSERAPADWGAFGEFITDLERRSKARELVAGREGTPGFDPERFVRQRERVILYSRVAGRGWLYFFRSTFAAYPLRTMEWLVDSLASSNDDSSSELLREIGLEWAIDPTGTHATQRSVSMPELADRSRDLRALIASVVGQEDGEFDGDAVSELRSMYERERLEVPEFPHDELDLEAMAQADPAHSALITQKMAAAQADLAERLPEFLAEATPLETLELKTLLGDTTGDVRSRRARQVAASPRVAHFLRPNVEAMEELEALGPHRNQMLRHEAESFARQVQVDGGSVDFVAELVQTRERVAWIVVPVEALCDAQASEVRVHLVDIGRSSSSSLRDEILADVKRADAGRPVSPVPEWHAAASWLVRPLLEIPRESRVALSLSQPWLSVPLENLPVLPGSAALRDWFAVTRKDESRRWIGSSRNGPAKPWLVVGNPGSDRPDAELEAREVAATFGVEPLVGADATVEAVRERLSVCGGLYLAGQGKLDQTAARPLLQLSDGYVSVESLIRGRLDDCRLVVLSTCLAAAAKPQGEEPGETAARIFLEAGASSVVAAPIRVDSAKARLANRSLAVALEGRWTTEALRLASQAESYSPWLLHGADLYHS